PVRLLHAVPASLPLLVFLPASLCVRHPHSFPTRRSSDLFRLTASIAVWDRSVRTLSAGMASASSRRPLCGVFGLMLFPLESPHCAHPDWFEYNLTSQIISWLSNICSVKFQTSSGEWKMGD